MEQIGALALSSLFLLGAAYVGTGAPAPTIAVRWRGGVTAASRAQVEQTHLLLDGHSPNPDVPLSLTYTLLDVSRGNIAALVNEPDVADTHFIDREGYTVSQDAEPSQRRAWIAHRLPGLRNSAVRTAVVGTLAAVAALGLQRRIVLLVIAALAAVRALRLRLLRAPFVPVLGRLCGLLTLRARDVMTGKGWLATGVADAGDWFDTALPAYSISPRHHRWSWAVKVLAAGAIIVSIGLPIIASWKAWLLFACLLGLVFGIARSGALRIACVVGITLAACGVKSLLPRADIAEGHNAFLVANPDEALQRGLPPAIFENWKRQFDAFYPLDPSQDVLTAGWRATPSQNVPAMLFAHSTDAIWRTPKYTRQVDAIDFRTLGEFRGGFSNESELEGAAHTIRYNFWAGPLDRKDMPFYVMYELTPASAGSLLTWQGQAFWQHPDGRIEEMLHSGLASRSIAKGDAGSRVYVAFFPARDRGRLFAMQPSLRLRAGAWGDVVVTVLASVAVLLLTTRVRWNAYLRALVLVAAGYLFLVTHADFQVDHLGRPFPPHAGGDDGLAFEGWGRTMAMLAGRGEWAEALRGAESVYWFTPGMRYFRMVEKLVFGDTNHLHTIAIIALPLVVFYVLRWFLRPLAAWVVTAAFCVMPFGSFSFLRYLGWGKAGYGESVGAGLFLLGLALILHLHPRWGPTQERNLALAWVAGAALAASMFIRPNFALAVVWLGLVYAWSLLRSRDVAAATLFASGLGLALWMPFHNWYFGGELYLVSRSSMSVALPIGVREYLSAAADVVSGRFDSSAVGIAAAQVRGWLWSDPRTPAEWMALVFRLVALAASCAVAVRAAFGGYRSRRYAPLAVVAVAALLAHVPMLFVHATFDRYAILGWDLSIIVLICAYPLAAAALPRGETEPDHYELAAHSRS